MSRIVNLSATAAIVSQGGTAPVIRATFMGRPTATLLPEEGPDPAGKPLCQSLAADRPGPSATAMAVKIRQIYVGHHRKFMETKIKLGESEHVNETTPNRHDIPAVLSL